MMILYISICQQIKAKDFEASLTVQQGHVIVDLIIVQACVRSGM
jgi:hypothetical protein